MQIRIAQILITPVLLVDDGVELRAGTQVEPIAIAPSDWAQFGADLPTMLANVQGEFDAQLAANLTKDAVSDHPVPQIVGVETVSDTAPTI